MYALKLTLHGKVQGVGYRRWFEQQAKTLELKGYVKNLNNGGVEAVVLGTQLAIETIMSRTMHTAPVHGRVDGILYAEVDSEVLLSWQDFQIVPN